MDTPADQIALSILEQRNEWLVNGVLKPATLGVLIADTIRAERKQAEQVTADAALVAEMSAMRAELEAVKGREKRMRDAIGRYFEMEGTACDYTGDEPVVCPGVEKIGGPCAWCELRASLK